MIIVERRANVGDLVTVRAMATSYQLPPGLSDGAVVRVITNCDHGYQHVEFNGQCFHVFTGCLDAGRDLVDPEKHHFQKRCAR